VDTLSNLESLGDEVFKYEPISMYFDDWIANLRQVILTFESSGVISSDEAFTKECTQIFSDVESELNSRVRKEAELDASAKTLTKDKSLLGEIDAGYAAKSKDLVVKEKSTIDSLIKNVQRLEEELARIQQIKTSYLHPLRKRAKEQKEAEVTEKLNAAKKKLALVVQNSAVEQGKVKAIDTDYASQIRELSDKRKGAIDFLAKNVHDLEDERKRIERIKVSNLHPLRKIAREEKLSEVTEKLIAAKKRLKLAEQSSVTELEKLDADYEKKKQAMIKEMQVLENGIAIEQTDSSLGARKTATNALANAVKSLVDRKTAPPTVVPEKAATKV